MRYNSNIDFWVPESDRTSEKEKTKATKQKGIVPSDTTGSGTGILYHVSKQSIVRVVPTADTLVVWSNDKDIDLPANLNEGFRLVANQEYFLSSGDFEYLVADLATLSVVRIRQKG